MARLRTPDGRPLHNTTSSLRVSTGPDHVQDPPGGLTAHPEMLAPFLEASGRLLGERMDKAEHDESLSVREQEQVIQSVLLGQAIVLGLEVYAAGQDRELLEVLNDLATTLDRINSLGLSFVQRLPAINQAARLGWLEGVSLLTDEYPHAVALVLQQAARAEVAVSPEAQARLEWAGYRAPFPLKTPLHPSRAALTPPATLEPAHMARERDLRELARSRVEGERNAALLLLHVNGRDRLENAPLLSVLDTAQMLLLALHRQCREAGGDSSVTETLLTLHGQLHQELGTPHLLGTQRFKRQPDSDAQTHTWRARRLLRALRADRHREPTPLEQQQQDTLWDALHALDRDLAAGITPDEDENLRVWLLLLGLQGLTSTSRAPGMNLPPMVQLAAQVSGLDPLWAWERTQPRGHLSTDLREELLLLIHCLLLLRLKGTSYWETWGQPVCRLTALAAGHLFATARRAGLRLPEQPLLETFFGQFGSLRALPLSDTEWKRAERTRMEAMRAAVDTLQAQGEQETPETSITEAVPVPESGKQGASAVVPVSKPEEDVTRLPPHVLAARERLSGQRVVLLGGVPSPPHQAALVRALELRELDWIGSEEYQHGLHARTRVTQDTALVILAIRWMAHAHNALRDVAREMGVPFVMHPGGLSPSSVAWQVMQQASEQLGRCATGTSPAETPGPSAFG
ncbi:hypothetical protein [Deinococcus budaensis]|uniref:DUF2325 domain-containing protein n=1 Tax=Deinococcus budaensis TaxID=1665626 RepID=A0A7W8GHH0_9DEIO|nr:hypothetical protein [Deinococcus budaensis]MBB5235558.1 hypothetical protein [Deinococcus budaensis]